MPISPRTKMTQKVERLRRELSELQEKVRLKEEEIEEVQDIITFKGPYKMKRDNTRFFSELR